MATATEIEKTAHQIHIWWSGALQVLVNRSERQADGSLLVPGALARLWIRQSRLSYDNLPQSTRDGYLAAARKILRERS